MQQERRAICRIGLAAAAAAWIVSAAAAAPPDYGRSADGKFKKGCSAVADGQVEALPIRFVVQPELVGSADKPWRVANSDGVLAGMAVGSLKLSTGPKFYDFKTKAAQPNGFLLAFGDGPDHVSLYIPWARLIRQSGADIGKADDTSVICR